MSGIVKAFDDLILGYTLKKLTGVFEELLAVSRQHYPDNMAGVLGMAQVKAAKSIPGWLKRVKCSSPFEVTHVLIEQMNQSRKFQHGLRIEAQAVLLEALVEAELAMDEASYSEFVDRN